jgi:hypothetical protein
MVLVGLHDGVPYMKTHSGDRGALFEIFEFD